MSSMASSLLSHSLRAPPSFSFLGISSDRCHRTPQATVFERALILNVSGASRLGEPWTQDKEPWSKTQCLRGSLDSVSQGPTMFKIAEVANA